MIFDVIICDAPFRFSDKLVMSDVKRGASSNYSTMSMSELKELPISKLGNPDGCVLAFWCPSSMLKDGIDIIETWGFCLKQTFIWNKVRKGSKDRSPTMGLGRLFRNCHEVALICTNTAKIYGKLKNRSQRTICFAENEKHSKKPMCLHDSLDAMFHGSKLEIFSRGPNRNGWVMIGNEAPDTIGEDIRVSLDKLINAK